MTYTCSLNTTHRRPRSNKVANMTNPYTIAFCVQHGISFHGSSLTFPFSLLGDNSHITGGDFNHVSSLILDALDRTDLCTFPIGGNYALDRIITSNLKKFLPELGETISRSDTSSAHVHNYSIMSVCFPNFQINKPTPISPVQCSLTYYYSCLWIPVFVAW